MSKTTKQKFEAVQKLAESGTTVTVSFSLFAGSLYDGDIQGETRLRRVHIVVRAF